MIKPRLRTQLYLLLAAFTIIIIIIQAFYYIRFSHLSIKRTQTYMDSTLSQIQHQVKSFQKDMDQLSNIIGHNETVQKFITEVNPYNRYVLSSDFYDVLDIKIWINENLKSIYILDKEGRMVSSSSESLIIVCNNILRDYGVVHRKPATSFYTKVYYNKTTKNYYFAYVCPIYNKKSYSSEPIGTILLLCDLNAFHTSLKHTNLTPQSLIAVTDQDQRIIIANKDHLLGSNLHSTTEGYSLLSSKKEKSMLRNYFTHAITLDELNWTLHLLLPKAEIIDDFVPVINEGLFLTIGFVSILFIFSILIIGNIIKPIKRITKELEHVGEGNIKYRLTITANNEIDIIAKDINGMLERMEVMTRKIFNNQDQLYSLELDKKQAELMALQSQINPHFLYNTLECIRSMGSYYKISDIQVIATSMAKIFRYAISNEQYVTVSDELDCIDDYMKVMNIRFMGKFKYFKDVDQDLLQLSMNKMLLQPLVENAVYHGLESIIGEGSLWIKATYDKANNYLCLQVKDNGKGIPSIHLEELQKRLYDVHHAPSNNNKRSIGLLNIHNRLRLSYGDNYGIKIHSQETLGTTILMYIPVLEKR